MHIYGTVYWVPLFLILSDDVFYDKLTDTKAYGKANNSQTHMDRPIINHEYYEVNRDEMLTNT